ncbi:hypothetical protein TNCT_378741 [Trichonephila clavata]|uniref:Uncharacterized protein n=1 Tax=Trichonephila clavata TaxID=2740835 RepID=A0A8X6HUK5_TRICU|nr:hypothetical protein TNCT_378741 [Trichonephila clavata]
MYWFNNGLLVIAAIDGCFQLNIGINNVPGKCSQIRTIPPPPVWELRSLQFHGSLDYFELFHQLYDEEILTRPSTVNFLPYINCSNSEFCNPQKLFPSALYKNQINSCILPAIKINSFLYQSCSA